MKLYQTLVRREFWEHRALWRAPAVMALLLVGVALFGRFEIGTRIALTAEQGQAIMGLTVWAVSLAIFAIAAVVLSFYLLDCLYAERRDRSVLFWKSLPVSDAATVLAKFAVAMLVVPLGVFVLALATDLVVRAILVARSGAGLLTGTFPIWDTRTWLQSQSLMLIGLVATLLWYAPLAAYLLAVSAWARRNVMMWSVLPPLVLVILERIALGSSHVSQFIAYRLSPAFPMMRGVDGNLATSVVSIHREQVISVPRLLGQIDIGAMFFNVPMLLGLVAAAVLLFAAIRVRRYRDDG